MTKKNTTDTTDTTDRPWTEIEDAILGTNPLAKVAATLNRPKWQILDRMRELGVRQFGVRVRPRNPARVAAEKALAERRGARCERQMRSGLVIAKLICAGRTRSEAELELGLGRGAVSHRLSKFRRLVFYTARLGQHMPPPIQKIECLGIQLLDEIERRMEIEFATGSLDVWAELLPTEIRMVIATES